MASGVVFFCVRFSESEENDPKHDGAFIHGGLL